jgi:preprotein translocase subunit SecG
MSFLLYFCVALLLIISVFLILLVLIQKGRGGGLASAFGGGGGNTAFGSKTGDVLTWATSIVFGIFLILSMGTVKVADTINAQRKATLGQTNQTSTPAAPAPAPAPVSPGPMSTPLPEAPSTQP